MSTYIVLLFNHRGNVLQARHLEAARDDEAIDIAMAAHLENGACTEHQLWCLGRKVAVHWSKAADRPNPADGGRPKPST